MNWRRMASIASALWRCPGCSERRENLNRIQEPRLVPSGDNEYIPPPDQPTKCSVDEMALFHLNYGDLIRPAYRILPSRGWGQCTNLTEDYLVVYGPKHQDENSIFDTSPYILPPGRTTPDRWDCDGFFLPSDRKLKIGRRVRSGPLAVKIWDLRHLVVRGTARGPYACSWTNGIFEPSQINWAIPNFTYEDVIARLK